MAILRMIESDFGESSFCIIVRLVETLKSYEGCFSIGGLVEDLWRKNESDLLKNRVGIRPVASQFAGAVDIF